MKCEPFYLDIPVSLTELAYIRRSVNDHEITLSKSAGQNEMGILDSLHV